SSDTPPSAHRPPTPKPPGGAFVRERAAGWAVVLVCRVVCRVVSVWWRTAGGDEEKADGLEGLEVLLVVHLVHVAVAVLREEVAALLPLLPVRGLLHDGRHPLPQRLLVG